MPRESAVEEYNDQYRNARSDKRKWIDEIADEAQKESKSNKFRERFQLSREIKGCATHAATPAKNKDGGILTM
jgi:hypothetical protein